jgi:hypothetical protein
LALEKVKWNVNKKGRVAEILTEVAMSSEESQEESDGEGGRKVVSYKIKKLKWKSERMKKAKKVLDKCYLKTLTQRAQDRILPRVVSHELSSRQVHDNFAA